MTLAPKNLQTIESHVLDLQRLHPSASGDFTSLLNDISFAAKVVSRDVTKAGLVEDILGATDEENIQGEVVQKLDSFANNVFLILGALMMTVFVGWVWQVPRFAEAAGIRSRGALVLWTIVIKYLAPLIILLTWAAQLGLIRWLEGGE